jgi:predicted ATP-grasp superfamily ATP-dependent carboligase
MYTYDAYMNQNSDVTHWVTCNKFRQYPINFGASSFTIQKYVEELHTIGAPFFKAMGYKGFAEIEFKKDAKTGEYYLIEINVRTTTLNSMLDKAGVNFPYVQYMELTGHELEPYAVKKDTNIAFWFEYEDILAIKAYIKTKQLKLKDVLPTFKRPIVCAVFDAHDIKPFFGMLGMIFGRFTKKIKRMVVR